MNKSLSCYGKASEFFKYPSMMSGIGMNYYFGLAGVHLRRMELEKAADILEKVRSLMEAQHMRMDIADVTLVYHLAEIKFLSGDKEGGALAVEEILRRYPTLNIVALGRLIHELDCAKKLSKEHGDTFLKELDEEDSYRIQPFMRLLRARLLFERGEAGEALRETDEIMAFSRMHGNKLRLVEAGLLKIYMLLLGEEKKGIRREIRNLLLEAIHYGWEDRILMPFYLDREVVLPFLEEFYMRMSSEKDVMSSGEAAFLGEILSICKSRAVSFREPDTLSIRELEVLKEMAQGITNREIADRLCISQATVKTHIISIFGKLGGSSRMLAVDTGKKKGLIQ